MKIYYWEEEGIAEFDEKKAMNSKSGRYGEKSEKIKDPITISMHIEIDRKKYQKWKQSECK